MGIFKSNRKRAEDASSESTVVVRNVVVAGAGPAGLLLACLLLRRNNETNERVQYKVTLLESRTDLGELDPDTDLKAHRSWMLGLAGHGLEAIRTIPELYSDYVKNIGVPISKLSIFMGSKEISTSADDMEEVVENFIVDRNFVVAAISRYLNATHGTNPLFQRRYRTDLLYVDHENHRVLTRNKTTKEETYLSYDLLVGADGIRSVVREALVKRHFDVELTVGDIFQNFKAVHVARPKVLDPNAMNILPDVFPHMQGIALPEKDGQVNISIGAPRNLFGKIAPELKSDDPVVVADYLRNNLKAFELLDYDDFAKQWTASRWNRTGMSHCNRYHSNPCKIVIMGDAAHATSPSIGMGMNTALRDAQKFHELLVRLDDNLEQVLPQFSQDRVKEGNSLTDLAFYLYVNHTGHQFVELLHVMIRTFLNKRFPSLVAQHAQTMIGNPKYSLAECYQAAWKQGVIPKHRRINDVIRQQHFELEAGMRVNDTKANGLPMLMVAICGVLFSAGACFYWNA